ncbi:MAG: hypothetical protein AAFN74_06950 [Myxococcota bacterium]
MMFSVIEVPPDVTRQDELLGTKPKFWFREEEPLAANLSAFLLFKRGRSNEDWSEKVAEVVANAIGLPTASVELAMCAGEDGTVSRSFLSEGDQMYHGNELLLARDADYPLSGTYRIRQHTVEAMFDAIVWNAAGVPPGFEGAWDDFDGCDLMVGYLALDVLIGNTDRHHENWAVIRRGPSAFIAPTYDHAASLGRNETLRRIAERLDGPDPRVTVEAYVGRGRSALYDPQSARALTTLEAFRRAASIRPSAARYWISKIRATPAEGLMALVEHVPDDRISPLNRRFAQAILLCNWKRLVAAHGD